MQIQLVKINSVKENPNNPRIIKDESFNKLVASLREFPEMLKIRPIVVDKKMVVLGGNKRLKACKELKLKEIYIIYANELTEDQKRRFTIVDNLSYGEWDFDLLRSDWDNNLLEEWGLPIPAFETAEEPEPEDFKEKTQFKIEVICKDPSHQERTYNKLIEQGHECRLLE